MKTATTIHQLDSKAKVKELVNLGRDTEYLLASIGVDTQIHSDKTLHQVCAEKKWNEEEVLNWIKKHHRTVHQMRGETPEKKKTDFRADWSVSERCSFLRSRYHDPVLDYVEQIEDLFPRVCKIHGIQYPYLKIIHHKFDSFKESLTFYIRFLHNRFFPDAERLEQQKSSVSDGTVQNLKTSVSIIREDRQKLEKMLDEFSGLTNEFTPPEGACSTLKMFLQDFSELVRLMKKQMELEEKHLNRDILKKIETI